MQHMITNVHAKYPRLNSTYRFDNAENNSVKCDPMEDGAAYETSFVMDDATAKDLHNVCMEAYKNAASLDSKRKWPEKPTYLPYKRDEEDRVVGKTKLKGSYGGEKTQAPKQVDAARNKLPDDFMLTSGSKMNLAVTIVPYNTGSINGVSLRLRAVQVLELQELAQGVDPFDQIEGGYVAKREEDPFAMPKENGATSNVAKSSVELDDEIPF